METSVRFILVRPEYPSNIGASARAIKTMGFRDLWLVRPRRFPHPEATRLATEAADVLDSARVVDSLDEALADCVFTVATSGRERAADWPLISAAETATRAADAGGRIAIVFGPEPSGLANDDLYRCRFQATIPTASDCKSLNLAQAVQIFAYELHQKLGAERRPERNDEPGTDAMLEHLYARIEDTVSASGFARYEPGHLLLRFRRIFNRAGLSAREASMLTGLFSRIVEKLGR